MPFPPSSSWQLCLILQENPVESSLMALARYLSHVLVQILIYFYAASLGKGENGYLLEHHPDQALKST